MNTAAAIALPGGQEIPLDYFRVFAFDAQTGKQLWESKPGFSFRGEVIDGGKSILVETVVQKEYSLQALDAKTGRRLWHFQTIRHDIWDLELPAPPTLVTGDWESSVRLVSAGSGRFDM